MSTLICVCIRWGELYDSDHVNRLYRAVKRNTKRHVHFIHLAATNEGLDDGITFIQLTEQPYEAEMLAAQKNVRKKNGALKKIAVFNPALYAALKGPVLVLDLDVVITGDLDNLYDFSPDHVCMCSPFHPNALPQTFGEGSVIKFDPDLHGFLYEEMAKAPLAAVNAAQGSEQTYTSNQAHKRGVFSVFPKDWIISFKRHCRPTHPFNLWSEPRLPNNARVVCFHGRPNIDEAEHGFKSDFLHSTRKCRWITKNWY